MLRELHWLSWDKASVRARVCEKHVAKTQERMVELDFNTLRQKCCSPDLFIGASTATVLQCVLYHPVPETFSQYVTSPSSQRGGEGRSPMTSCTSCTRQEMWLSRSPFACKGMFNVCVSSSQEGAAITGFQRCPPT